VDGDDEVEAGEDGGEAGDEHADGGEDDAAVGKDGAVGGVEGPAGIDAAGDCGDQAERAADHEDVPAEQVEAREGQVARAQHHGEDEIADGGGDGGNEEEEDHDHAVEGEEFVVSVVGNQVSLGCHQVEADDCGEDAADEEENGHRDQIKDADALVIEREEPGFDRVRNVDVGVARLEGGVVGDGGHISVRCPQSVVRCN
jgi:hypothetical protein